MDNRCIVPIFFDISIFLFIFAKRNDFAMNRNDLKEKYNIVGENNDIALFRKDHEKSSMGYCGNISVVRGKAVFCGKKYETIDGLDTALRQWEAGLEWPVDTYCPLFNERYRLENRIHWYIINKLGFKEDFSDWNVRNRYVREIGPSCKLNVSVFNVKDKVNISSEFGGITLTQEVEDIDTAVSVISHIVRETVLLMAKDMVSVLSVLPEEKITEIQMFVKSNNNFFGVEKADFKSVMIELLEKELKELKGE